MKTLFLTMILLAWMKQTSQAQDDISLGDSTETKQMINDISGNELHFKKFRFGVGVGTGFPVNNGGESLVSLFLTLEPAWRIRDDVSIGLRWEDAVFMDSELFITNYNSLTMNIQQYTSTRKFRPFVGLGFGLYRVTSDFLDKSKQLFGLYPRVGFEIPHFSVSIDFNQILTAKGTIPYISNNYLGIRIGVFFGGERIQSTEKAEG